MRLWRNEDLLSARESRQWPSSPSPFSLTSPERRKDFWVKAPLKLAQDQATFRGFISGFRLCQGGKKMYEISINMTTELTDSEIGFSTAVAALSLIISM